MIRGAGLQVECGADDAQDGGAQRERAKQPVRQFCLLHRFARRTFRSRIEMDQRSVRQYGGGMISDRGRAGYCTNSSMRRSVTRRLCQSS